MFLSVAPTSALAFDRLEGFSDFLNSRNWTGTSPLRTGLAASVRVNTGYWPLVSASSPRWIIAWI